MVLTQTMAVAYLVSAAAAFVVTFIGMPRLIQAFAARGMVGKDMNKADHREVAEMGGVAVVVGFFVGTVILMGFDSFADQTVIPQTPLFLAGLIASLGAAFVGAIDDLFDLRQRTKALLPALFGFPLGFVVVDQAVHLPGHQSIYLGALMIPILAFMVSAGANASNMLEGFNGLGAGLALVMSAALGFLAVYAGRYEALVILGPLLGATVAFLWFNRYPAKVFPGDTFTLFSGSAIVTTAISIDLKEVAALLFIPMIAEFFLKARGRFTHETYGTPDEHGRLAYAGEIGSLTHVVMKVGANTERKVVWSIWGAETILATLVVLLIVF